MANGGAIDVALRAKVDPSMGNALRQAENALKSYTKMGAKGFKDAADAADKNTKSVGSLATSIGKMAAAWLSVQTVMKAADLASLGQQAAAARTVFDSMGGSLEKLRKQTRGLVADFDLVQQANLAQTMGISADAFGKLADIAGAASVKTGQDMKAMLESITLGTARESKMILDNLGIMIDVDSVNKRYAQTLGKTASALSDAEKKQAFLNEVLSQGDKMMKEVAASGADMTNPIAEMKAAFDNAAVALGQRLMPAFRELLSAFKEVGGNDALKVALGAIGIVVDGLVFKIREAVNQLKLLFAFATGGYAGLVSESERQDAARLSQRIGTESGQFNKIVTSLAGVNGPVAPPGAAGGGGGGGGDDKAAREWAKKWSASLKDMIKAQEDWIEHYENNLELGTPSDMEVFGFNTPQFQKTDPMSIMPHVETAAEAWRNTFNAMAAEAADVRNTAINAGKIMKANGEMESLRAQKAFLDAMFKFDFAGMQSAGIDIIKAEMLPRIGKGIGELMGKAFSFMGDGVTSMLPEAMSVIGGALGKVADVVVGLLKTVASGIKKLADATVGEFFRLALSSKKGHDTDLSTSAGVVGGTLGTGTAAASAASALVPGAGMIAGPLIILAAFAAGMIDLTQSTKSYANFQRGMAEVAQRLVQAMEPLWYNMTAFIPVLDIWAQMFAEVLYTLTPGPEILAGLWEAMINVTVGVLRATVAFLQAYNVLNDMWGGADLQWHVQSGRADDLETLLAAGFMAARGLYGVADATDSVVDSLSNVPDVLKVSAARYLATKDETGAMSGGAYGGLGGNGSSGVGGSRGGNDRVIMVENFYLTTTDPDAFWRAIGRDEMVRSGSTGRINRTWNGQG